MFFQTHKGSLQVFRYCSIFKVLYASALRLTTCLLYHRSGFLSSLIFLEAFELSELGHSRSFSEQTGTFSASIGSFQGLPAVAPEVILLPQRLALKYNTTPPPPCQHFLTDFFQFLCRIKNLPVFHPLQDAPFFLTRQCTERIMELPPYPVLYSYTYSIREKRHVLCQHRRRARYSGALLYYIYIILRCRGGLCL